jgi:hypothetical protein
MAAVLAGVILSFGDVPTAVGFAIGPAVDGSIQDGQLELDGSVVQILHDSSSEYRGLIEFSLAGVSLPIVNAVLELPVFDAAEPPFMMDVFGYSGDGVLRATNWNAGAFVTSFEYSGESVITLDATTFLTKAVSAASTHAGFNFRFHEPSPSTGPMLAFDSLDFDGGARLRINEVPEPSGVVFLLSMTVVLALGRIRHEFQSNLCSKWKGPSLMCRSSLSVFCVTTWMAIGAFATAVERPTWMDEPGIVMAGSWEAPAARARLMGRTDYTLPPEKLADYAREHSPEMIAELKELGVNFLMIHCYKGAGMKTERQGLEDARQFARVARQSGMRVGAYIGGTLFYERLFEEEPESPQWQTRDPKGQTMDYGDQQHRHLLVRNHPGVIEYFKKPIRFAVEEVGADLIHFDNFGYGVMSYDSYSKERFREYLRRRGMDPSDPPAANAPVSQPLVQAWQEYQCDALAEHYAAMSKYIRSLNPQCAVECNPGAAHGGAMASFSIDPVRLLPLGNAFWDEGWGAAWSEKDGVAQTRIRTLKVGELYNNSAFVYSESALDVAESMAFNVNCLGSVAWFEWGKIVAAHQQSSKPPAEEMKPYIRFFLDHQDLYRRWSGVADVAVLRTFGEQCFGSQKYYPIEQALIQGHVAWRMIFDPHLDDLDGYRVLVVPADQWLTAEQKGKIARFAGRGGQVVRSTDIPNPKEFADGFRNGNLRVVVDAPSSVALELRRQNELQRALIHLVNYNVKQPITNVAVKLRVKQGTPTSVRFLSPDPAVSEPIPFQVSEGECRFVVPALRVYGAIVVEGIGI